MPVKRATSSASRSARIAKIIASGRNGDVREAAQLVQLLAQMIDSAAMRREKIKTLIPRVAEKLDFEQERTRAMWWQEARRIDAWEMDALRNAVRQRRRAAK